MSSDKEEAPMKEYLSGLLSIKLSNYRNLKKELCGTTGYAQKLIMDAMVEEKRQIDHIVYLGNTY